MLSSMRNAACKVGGVRVEVPHLQKGGMHDEEFGGKEEARDPTVGSRDKRWLFRAKPSAQFANVKSGWHRILCNSIGGGVVWHLTPQQVAEVRHIV